MNGGFFSGITIFTIFHQVPDLPQLPDFETVTITVRADITGPSQGYDLSVGFKVPF
ncbi:MAG: hypothetical protein Q8S00_32175 [Deltaproteobacteria bacterium]|nr:hypothetical protein [Deltaproteobacteria bacterium]MDP2607218.1 hypothetical protein [Deltaproteobacteria bacterium]